MQLSSWVADFIYYQHSISSMIDDQSKQYFHHKCLLQRSKNSLVKVLLRSPIHSIMSMSQASS